MAAVFACGDGAGLSHACATALWEIRPYTGTWIDVTVPPEPAAPGATAFACTAHPPSTPTTSPRIAASPSPRSPARSSTSPQRCREPSLARTVEQTEIRRLFDLDGGRADARAPSPPPRRRATRCALELYRDDEFSRSELEKTFLALCDAHGIPRPLVNHIVEGKEVDFFWPDQRRHRRDRRPRHALHDRRLRGRPRARRAARRARLPRAALHRAAGPAATAPPSPNASRPVLAPTSASR